MQKTILKTIPIGVRRRDVKKMKFEKTFVR